MKRSPTERLRGFLEAGNRRIDFGRPAARALIALLGLAAIAALGSAVWLAFLDTRFEAVTVTDPRAAYVNNIRGKIQEATEAAYSKEPRRGQGGSLVLRIELNSDGKLVSAAVARSSGNPDLDDLALRVVRDSAPYEPFPEAVRRTTRVVEITSTFNFN